MMKVSTLIILLHLTFANKPIERENGIWYPGKGCGITTEIKYLSELPNDVSDLTCTFIQNPNTKKIDLKGLKMDPECFKTGNPNENSDVSITKKESVETVEQCMELCLESTKCGIIEYHPSPQNCYLIDQDLPMPINVAANYAKYASKSCILKSWYKYN